MNTLAARTFQFRTLAIAASLVVGAAIVAVVFSAWMRYAPEIFLTLSDNGINWCL